jgi:hypothetical protein
MYKHLINIGLNEALLEASQFNLILTFPTSNAAVELSFSSVKKLKAFLWSSQSQNRFPTN